MKGMPNSSHREYSLAMECLGLMRIWSVFRELCGNGTYISGLA